MTAFLAELRDFFAEFIVSMRETHKLPSYATDWGTGVERGDLGGRDR